MLSLRPLFVILSAMDKPNASFISRFLGLNRSWKERLRSIAWLILFFVALPSFVVRVVIARPTLASSPKSELTADPSLLEKHVRVLSEDLAPRSYLHFKNLNATADYIRAELDDLGAPGAVTDQGFEVHNRRFRNISLLLNPEVKKPRVVVGAHYDGFGEFPAADDNASGVAGLIELGRLLVAQRVNQFPIELVAYPLEEPPHFATPAMGSSQHAFSLREEKTEVRLMISLEMIGTFSDEWGSQAYPSGFLHLMYPPKGNFIAVVGRTDMRDVVKGFKIGMKGTTDLPVYSIAAPAALPGIDFSDHRNYWEEGFPALMVTDTAFFRNEHYHTPEDTADRLDYERMSDVVVAVFEAIAAMEP